MEIKLDWIPVKEKLPEESGWFYVTLKVDDEYVVDEAYYTSYTKSEHKWSFSDGELCGVGNDFEVVAYANTLEFIPYKP